MAMSNDRLLVKTTNEFPPRRENEVYVRKSGFLSWLNFFGELFRVNLKNCKNNKLNYHMP